ncbi:hypothetical protein [Streptomyces sp. NPDC091278]|uniref:hypothetical protein n=1 Tax=Streptomyces sp. NPDC091278 TaxID=3155301 RepID=UPI00344EF072
MEQILLLVKTVDAAAYGDRTGALALMREVLAFSSSEEMYAACCALAELARQTLDRRGALGPGEMYEVTPPPPHGDCSCHSANTFAACFLTARVNRDEESAEQLFALLMEQSSRDFDTGFAALVLSVAAIVAGAAGPFRAM